MAYLYRHIRLDKNEPFYIGIGSDSSYKRAYSKHNRNKYWKNVINMTEYKIEIMLDDIDWKTACEKEKEFIQLYRSNNLHLTNMTAGGEGIFNPSEELRKKISDSKLGSKNPFYGKKWSKEKREMFRIRMQGVNNPNFGKVISDEQKLIIANAQKGRIKSSEEKEKIYSKTRKKVINTETNEVYASIQETAIVFNKSASHMTRLIKKNKFNLKFLTDANI